MSRGNFVGLRSDSRGSSDFEFPFVFLWWILDAVLRSLCFFLVEYLLAIGGCLRD